MKRSYVQRAAILASFATAMAFTAIAQPAAKRPALHDGSCKLTTVRGQTIEGSCISEDYACGCATSDGQLYPSEDCAC